MKTVIGIMVKLGVHGLSTVNIGYLFSSRKVTLFLLLRTFSLFFPFSSLMLSLFLLDLWGYRYVFGDVHLGQSCRLRNSSAQMMLHYL